MIAKVNGQWAFVSRRTRRPLAYWRGEGKPPKWWIDKQERRVQYFKRNPEGGSSEEGGWTQIDALVAVGSLGALCYGIASYKPSASSDADQERNKMATSSLVIGSLAGLLLLTTKASNAIGSPAGARSK